MKNLAIRPRWMGLMYRPVHLKTLALKNVETLVIFSLIILNFHKNIKKVRDIDKICNNATIDRNPSFIDINNNETVKNTFVGIQIHFVLIHRSEGYCKILYTQKVNDQMLQ